MWEMYVETKKRFESSTQEKITQELEKAFELDRICCKRMLVCHVEVIDQLLKYNRHSDAPTL